MLDERSLFGRERWPASELASVLLLSTQRINQLVKEGTLPAPIEGRYSPQEAVSAYVRFLQEHRRTNSYKQAATRRIELANELTELKLRKTAGQR